MKFRSFILIALITLFYWGCGIYSFSGINTEGAQTIYFNYFDNTAKINNAYLPQLFYDEIYKRFVKETNLKFQQNNADIVLEGQIIDYNISSVNITSADAAASNRLTITVKIKYSNFKKTTSNFEKNFTWYADYSSNELLTDIEDKLCSQIVQKIVDDLFNSTLVNW